MRGEIRNKERLLSQEDTLELIKMAEHGVLATINEANQPCTTALNHVYLDGELYFHSGLEGEKLDNIKIHPDVSYFIIGVADVIYDQFTTAFSSAVVHGTMTIVDDPEEKHRALTALVDRYSSEIIPSDAKRNFILDGLDCVSILKLVPEHISGKARLRRKRPCLQY